MPTSCSASKGGQNGLEIMLWIILDEDDTDAQLKTLLDVLALPNSKSIGDSPFSSGLKHFLAVLSIHARIDHLNTAKSYLYTLAGVVYCMRVLRNEELLAAAHHNEQTDKDCGCSCSILIKLLAQGIWFYGYRKIAGVLSVNVEYSGNTAKES
jgi:hypothetical protein